MRKFLALVMLAVFAMILGVALIGCQQQTSTSEPPADTTAPPAETSMPADTGMGGMSADTTMSH